MFFNYFNIFYLMISVFLFWKCFANLNFRGTTCIVESERKNVRSSAIAYSINTYWSLERKRTR